MRSSVISAQYTADIFRCSVEQYSNESVCLSSDRTNCTWRERRKRSENTSAATGGDTGTGAGTSLREPLVEVEEDDKEAEENDDEEEDDEESAEAEE